MAVQRKTAFSAAAILSASVLNHDRSTEGSTVECFFFPRTCPSEYMKDWWRIKRKPCVGPSPSQLLRDAVRRAAWKAGEASVAIPERVILSLSLVEGLGYHNEWMQLGSPLTESQTALGLRWSQSAVTLTNSSSRTERRRSVSSQTSDMFYKRGCRAVEVSSSGHACWWPRFKKTKQNTFFWLIHGPHFFCIGLRPFL